MPTRILASIIAGRSMPPRPLIQLGVIEGDGAGAGTAPSYALGTAQAGGVAWHAVGPLDWQPAANEQLLLAGLSVLAMRYVREAQVQIGDPVLVLGSDPWSLLLLQWARLQGASPLVFGRDGSEVLGRHAASIGVDADLPEATPGELARAVKLTHRAAGFAVVVDAITSQQSMTQSLSVLRDGGRLVLAGLSPQPHVSLNVYPDLHRRDLQIVSALRPAADRDFAELFRFGQQLAEAGRLHWPAVNDEASGWRVVAGDLPTEQG